MKIIADNAIPFLRGVLEPCAEVVYLPGEVIAPADVRDADALLVRTRTRCDERLLAGSSVRSIATATIGFDHIDTSYCRAQGIEVTTAAGCNARGVLQYIGAALAFLARKQGWRPGEKTLGIVGVGHVGSLVEAYARAWGFRIAACDPPRGLPLSFEEVTRQADILTFHVPLDDSTHHMLDTRLLRPGCMVINTSRGEVIDERSMRGGDYIFDVWEREPAIDPSTLEHAILATPHIAGYSLQGKANATAAVVRAVGRRFGWPLHDWYPPQVTPSRPRPISWEELCATIGDHFDIEAESRRLKAAPSAFEQIRNGYRYREEYF